jgi:hypothetical protein
MNDHVKETTMKRFPIRWMLVLALSLVPGSVWAQTVKVDSQQKQLVLSTSSIDTMRLELDAAGKLGFRVVMGTTRGNGELVLLLERDLRATPTLQFRLISTQATESFKREMGDAALQGFRVIPRTFLNKGGAILVVMERTAAPAGPPKRYEYTLLATNQTSSLEKEWIVAISQNYVPSATITRTELMLLMEREGR